MTLAERQASANVAPDERGYCALALRTRRLWLIRLSLKNIIAHQIDVALLGFSAGNRAICTCGMKLHWSIPPELCGRPSWGGRVERCWWAATTRGSFTFFHIPNRRPGDVQQYPSHFTTFCWLTLVR